MSTNIATLLGELKTDHRNIARLIDLLEQQGDELYSEGTPDLDLMCDIMRYIAEYADTVHHPKEDKLYAELRAVRPDLSSGLGRIGDEHRALGEQSLSLIKRLEAVVEGDAGSRKLVVADALRYADLLRKHMRWEETDLFRRLARMVADGHGELSIAVVVDRRDPLFGSEVEQRFAELYRRVTGEI